MCFVKSEGGGPCGVHDTATLLPLRATTWRTRNGNAGNQDSKDVGKSHPEPCEQGIKLLLHACTNLEGGQ